MIMDQETYRKKQGIVGRGEVRREEALPNALRFAQTYDLSVMVSRRRHWPTRKVTPHLLVRAVGGSLAMELGLEQGK